MKRLQVLMVIVGITQFVLCTVVVGQPPVEQLMFEKNLSQGKKLIVKRRAVPIAPPAPKELEANKKYLSKAPPGTRWIRADHAYEYTFTRLGLDANDGKTESVLWSPTFYSFENESLTHLADPVAQILDATEESDTLIVTLKVKHWDSVFANIVQKNPDGSYKVLPTVVQQLDLPRDDEGSGPVTNSAIISGSLKDGNLTVTTKDTDDYQTRFLWKNDRWEKQPGPPRPKRQEEIPPRPKNTEPPPPESDAFWKEKPGTKYEGEGLHVKLSHIPAGKVADFTESMSLLPADVKAGQPQATELFWAEDHHWQNLSTGPKDDFGWMSFYALWSRRVNAVNAAGKPEQLKFFDALHEPIGAKADVAGAFAILFQQDGVLFAAITRPGDKGARAVMTDTAATLQTGIIGEQIKSAKFSGSIAAGTLAVEAQFETGPSKRWTLKSQDDKDQWTP